MAPFPSRENLRHSESGWLSGNMDFVAVVVLATLCVSCDYIVLPADHLCKFKYCSLIIFTIFAAV